MDVSKVACPNCKEETLRHPAQAQSEGSEDTTKVECGTCGARWKADGRFQRYIDAWREVQAAEANIEAMNRQAEATG